jgi:predicted dehydrogenase
MGANDRVRVAVIGMGGRSRDHMKALLRVPGVEVAALCDPDQEQMAGKAAMFEKMGGTSKPALVADVRKVLDDKNIDVITIATPNHWHALGTVWGCQAGKHVYVEKPVCHDVWEGLQMVAAARKYNRIVQGGTQRRSNVYIRKAIQALHEGIIGDIFEARSASRHLRPRRRRWTGTCGWGRGRCSRSTATWCTTTGTGSGPTAAANWPTTACTSWTLRAGACRRNCR